MAGSTRTTRSMTRSRLLVGECPRCRPARRKRHNTPTSPIHTMPTTASEHKPKVSARPGAHRVLLVLKEAQGIYNCTQFSFLIGPQIVERKDWRGWLPPFTVTIDLESSGAGNIDTVETDRSADDLDQLRRLCIDIVDCVAEGSCRHLAF